MLGFGVAYAAVVQLGYDRWLQATLNKRHQEPLLLLILMLMLLAQEAVLLLAAVLI
jgi:hypothetical protein